MRRREFAAVLGGAAGFLFRAHARSGERAATRVRRLGAVTVPAAHDPLQISRAAAVVDGFAAPGWRVGDNLDWEWRRSGAIRNCWRRRRGDRVRATERDVFAKFTIRVTRTRRGVNKETWH